MNNSGKINELNNRKSQKNRMFINCLHILIGCLSGIITKQVVL